MTYDRYQSEARLEADLLKQLGGMKYRPVKIPDEAALITNLKKQLQLHNGETFSDAEFAKILNHLEGGSIFARAEKLRDKFRLDRDDGSRIWIEFLNIRDWCQNQYQVTSQVTQEGRYQNRYDVTLLINGLPLCQIELKRRGIEIMEAFNQVKRYQKHTFGRGSGLFGYVQVFVISNGVNTRYYANNARTDAKQTFVWADDKNVPMNPLSAFAQAFLEPCHLSKMICRYTVLHQSLGILMVLRPYQVHAVERIVKRVEDTRSGGYIWHTTGSGKTLTSFKTAQIVKQDPKVDKVVFVVDRADLDYQTMEEFNHFKPGSVDGTDDTSQLVEQFTDGASDFVLTTIQKMNHALKNPRFTAEMESIADKRIVFIFDECHRSQFGETHMRIVKHFPNRQMFGFTGTPIFAVNSPDHRTTGALFGDQLHSYVITDAIRDQNVLPFAVDYWGRAVMGDDDPQNQAPVEGIDRKEWLESDDRVNTIVDWVIENHNAKTHDRQFSAMMCVSNTDMVVKYYDAFRKRFDAGEHDLRVATIYTFAANPDDGASDGMIEDVETELGNLSNVPAYKREALDKAIADYNTQYGTAFSTQGKGFSNYYKDLSKRMKNREKTSAKPEDRLDILLVVNMFLTGFDAKALNTLYVDKRLRHHGLIQAFSRTNRIFGPKKSQGNIIVFRGRGAKALTDEAVAMFSTRGHIDHVVIEPYDKQVEAFNRAVAELIAIAPTPASVDSLPDEQAQLAFVQAFRAILRLHNVLQTFAEFTFADLMMPRQMFEDFKSKYLDLRDATRSRDEPNLESILQDVDFELELVHQDTINVSYILSLLGELAEAERDGPTPQSETRRADIQRMLDTDIELRSKRELIEEFIESWLPNLNNSDDVRDAYGRYMSEKREKALDDLCKSQGLKRDETETIVSNMVYRKSEPLEQELEAAMVNDLDILEREEKLDSALLELREFGEKFDLS